MNICGIIVEYNPFHNGHLYHIEQVKKQAKCDLLIAVMSGNFTQRGDMAIIDKFKRTELALMHGVDVVIELPYYAATSSADLFAFGAVSILNHLQVNALYFGSESNDVRQLNRIARIIDTQPFNDALQAFLDKGESYPKASHMALKMLLNDETILYANDLLGIQYIRSILKLQSNMTYHTIKRVSNHYNDQILSDGSIASATSIREAIKNKLDINDYVPKQTLTYIKEDIHLLDDYFELLKYQLIVGKDTLDTIHDMTEGIHHRILKQIEEASDFKTLLNQLTSKRHTESKMRRLLLHVLTGYTEVVFQEAPRDYMRLLGIKKTASPLFKQLTKQLSIPLITNITQSNYHYLKTEMRVDAIYHLFDKKPLRKIPIVL